jgi:D-sedoheptulose 7-phosphate isomerase
MGLQTVALTGGSGGKLKDAADHCLCAPSNQTPRIQECHILMGHVISELVEQTIFREHDAVSGS